MMRRTRRVSVYACAAMVPLSLSVAVISFASGGVSAGIASLINTVTWSFIFVTELRTNRTRTGTRWNPRTMKWENN